MANLIKDRMVTRKSPGTGFGYPVLAGVKIFGRAIVAITAAGFAVLPDHADAIKVVGIAEEAIDNTTGDSGDQYVEVENGPWNLPVDGADVSHIGDTVYAADDQVLQLTNAGGELAAGTLKTIDQDGPWVVIG